jgi:hypothetical protein
LTRKEQYSKEKKKRANFYKNEKSNRGINLGEFCQADRAFKDKFSFPGLETGHNDEILPRRFVK